MDYRSHHYRSSCGRLDLFARIYEGDGPPLLLMHGLTRNSADFEPLAHHLAGRYRLIVPDQRGRGLSDSDPDAANYRPDVYSADMFALLDDLGIDAVLPIGTSMGGLMAMAMNAMKPGRIRGAVLNDIGPLLDPAGLQRIGGYVGHSAAFADWEEAVGAIADINQDAFPGFAERDWLAFARRTCRVSQDDRVEFAYDPAIASAFDASAEQPDLWPLWEALSGKPVLVLRGALSDLLSADVAREMGERHEGPFTLVEVADRGHAPLLDEPEALAALDTFLKDHGG